jgi:hypothetical protein
MVRLAIVDAEGKQVDLKEIASAAELTSLADQARKVIRDCEQLAAAKRPKPTAQTGRVPYSS